MEKLESSLIYRDRLPCSDSDESVKIVENESENEGDS